MVFRDPAYFFVLHFRDPAYVFVLHFRDPAYFSCCTSVAQYTFPHCTSVPQHSRGAVVRLVYFRDPETSGAKRERRRNVRKEQIVRTKA